MIQPIKWTIGGATIEALIRGGDLKRRPTFDSDLNQGAFDDLAKKITSIETPD